MGNTSPITVLIADDQQLLLLMYKQVLESYGMKIVGQAKSPQETINLYRELKPHVLLLDIRFGMDGNGFDALTEIMKLDPFANVVVISQFDQGPYISRAYSLGAKSFLNKDCDPETLYSAVKAASLGQKFHMKVITDKVMDLLVNPDPDPKQMLSETDFQIFMYLAEGLRNDEIAAKLEVQNNYVSQHRQKIQEILKIDRPQQFSLLAIRHGLLTP